MAVVTLLVFVWSAGVFASWLPFWLWRTDPSMAPAQRRARSLGHAVLWPVHVVAYFAGRADHRARPR